MAIVIVVAGLALYGCMLFFMHGMAMATGLGDFNFNKWVLGIVLMTLPTQISLYLGREG
jgi:hypothetical protein